MHITALILCTLAAVLPGDQELVEVGNQPLGYRLTFTEEVRFGSEEEDDVYLWTGLQTKIIPAPNGGMFIFDHDSSRVLLFDEAGKFVKQVARKGEGPGELQYINAVSRSADGKIYVVDTPAPGNTISIKRFFADMTYRDVITTTDMAFRPSALFVSPDEKYMAGLFITFHPPTRGLAHKTGVLRLEDKVLVNDFTNALVPLPSLAVSDQNEWIDIIAKGTQHRFQQGLLAVGGDGTLYTARSDKYEIAQWKPGASAPHRVVRRTYKPKMFTEQDLADLVEQQYGNMDERARSRISRSTVEKGFAKARPAVHPPLLTLIALEDLGVLAIREANSATRLNRADVYAKDGRFLCELEVPDAGLCIRAPGSGLPVSRMTFHKGKAYAIIADEDGEQMAIRYAYSLEKR